MTPPARRGPEQTSVQPEAADQLPTRYRTVLDDYVTELQQRSLSERARSLYRIRAAAYLLWLTETRTTPDSHLPAGTRWTSRQATTSYRHHLDAAGRKPWTVNSYLSVAEDLIATISGKPVQPAERHPTPRPRTHILTLDEEARLAATLPDLSARDQIMIMLLWDMAAKPADVVALRARDVTPASDPTDGRRRGYMITLGEGARRRSVYVPPRLAAALAEHLPDRPTGYGGNRFLLTAKSPTLASGGDRLTERSISMITANIGAAAAQPQLTPTMLRRTALTAALTEPDAGPDTFQLLAWVDPIHARQVPAPVRPPRPEQLHLRQLG